MLLSTNAFATVLKMQKHTLMRMFILITICYRLLWHIDIKNLQKLMSREDVCPALNSRLTEALITNDVSNIHENWNVFKAPLNDVTNKQLKINKQADS